MGKVAATWKMPSPRPSPAGEGADCGRPPPRGREQIAADFAVAGGFKSSVGMTGFWCIY
ncbi:hypothetical protein E4K46_07760 [Neisseria meningitidis]|nr:hypothetical protein [Neisseria meningitidis]MBG8684644.1 hypothetical protein [Neisseria meningitidis]MBG8712223.1 hypothetical protein [Neisseria meningitidis]MBG8740383.1 hypothetical protein [Neisseria meningitidis]MBG8821154.1 hypothetical protein [Neisseria meningitidis]